MQTVEERGAARAASTVGEGGRAGGGRHKSPPRVRVEETGLVRRYFFRGPRSHRPVCVQVEHGYYARFCEERALEKANAAFRIIYGDNNFTDAEWKLATSSLPIPFKFQSQNPLDVIRQDVTQSS